MAAFGEGRRVQFCPQVFKSFIVLPPPWLEGFPLLGFGPAFPSASRALFIDWKLTYKLIFYLLISPTAAASCQRSNGGINGNLV